MTNLVSILKSRNITLPTKVYLVKAMVFPVVMYGCESWTVKKAECQRIDVFELCVLLWEFLGLQVQPVHHKGDQSSVFIGRTNEAESPILWPPDVKSWLIWKDPDAGKDRRQEKGMTGWDGWMTSLTRWTWVWVDSGSWWWTGRPGMLRFMGLQRVGHDWATELTALTQMIQWYDQDWQKSCCFFVLMLLGSGWVMDRLVQIERGCPRWVGEG